MHVQRKYFQASPQKAPLTQASLPRRQGPSVRSPPKYDHERLRALRLGSSDDRLESPVIRVAQASVARLGVTVPIPQIGGLSLCSCISLGNSCTLPFEVGLKRISPMPRVWSGADDLIDINCGLPLLLPHQNAPRLLRERCIYLSQAPFHQPPRQHDCGRSHDIRHQFPRSNRAPCQADAAAKTATSVHRLHL